MRSRSACIHSDAALRVAGQLSSARIAICRACKIRACDCLDRQLISGDRFSVGGGLRTAHADSGGVVFDDIQRTVQYIVMNYLCHFVLLNRIIFQKGTGYSPPHTARITVGVVAP